MKQFLYNFGTLDLDYMDNLSRNIFISGNQLEFSTPTIFLLLLYKIKRKEKMLREEK